MRLAIESVEVATLKEDGSPWDGPGGPRLSRADLPAFFSLDLTGQLERLVATGEAPTPPDVFVRLYAAGKLVLETRAEKSLDPHWRAQPDEHFDLAPGTAVKIQVWDEDVVFNDLIGETSLPLPDRPPDDGRWSLEPFGQVRRLFLRVG